MFVIRQAKPADLDDLHSLAKQTFFINLPPDRDIIARKIAQSQASFSSAATAPQGKGARAGLGNAGRSGSTGGDAAGIGALTGRSDLFLFVLEDTDTGGVIGTSQVIARMGGKGHPRVALALGTMTRRSTALKIDWTHQTAQIARDESGPSEIGGLILNHAFRGHKQRLGRFLSFVRFHFIGLHRARFASRVVAEMLGPIDKTGYNPFFEKFTRHFIPRPFPEVYRFSQTSKEFVTGLMPPGEIDLSIMDPEVAHAAGAVGDDTAPARRMLERLGFAYKGHIDPLDGGPHLEAVTDKISLVAATGVVRAVERLASRPTAGDPTLLVSTLTREGEFLAIQTKGKRTAKGIVKVSPSAMSVVCRGATMGATTLPA